MNRKDKIRLIQEVKLSVYNNVIESLFSSYSDFDEMDPKDKLQLHTIIRYGNKLSNKYLG